MIDEKLYLVTNSEIGLELMMIEKLSFEEGLMKNHSRPLPQLNSYPHSSFGVGAA